MKNKNMEHNLSTYWTEQYNLVRESRKVLLDYCNTIFPHHLTAENSSFGRGGSIRILLVHIANTYEFWIGKQALQRDMVFTSYISMENTGQIEAMFENIDKLMLDFTGRFGNAPFGNIEFEIDGTGKSATPFRLFTHVITHEFHHKGQILSISRQLGYTPVDTDIMR